MDRLLVTRQGVDAAYVIPDNVSRLGAAVECSNPPKVRRHCAYKAPGVPSLEHLYPLALVCVPSSTSLSQSTHSPVWVGDLILMASTCCQPIIHSYPHAFIMESGFQSSKPPTSSDTSRLGCTARFNLSAMDLPVSMNGRFQVPPAASQLLPSARTADLSKDREIFDSDDDDDNDLPSVKQILASSKWPKQVIDLTGDDDDDRERRKRRR